MASASASSSVVTLNVGGELFQTTPATLSRAGVAIPLSPHAASLVAAHGGVVTSFNAALASRTSVLTPLPTIDSLVAVSPALALAGARDFPGVQLCRFPGDAPATASDALYWPDSPSSSVLSMAASEPASHWLFASFESARRNSSAVVAFDLNSLSPVVEIGRKEVFGAGR
uniref:Potassium channel tetramerisation-type BTB domain-containing protein n=1 Tax=Aegilops tauschii TaxID=37682 RepID=N1QSI7_AEGTA